MDNGLKEIREAHAKVRAAERARGVLIEKYLRPGTRVRWTRGKGSGSGKVVLCSSDTIKVSSDRSGAEYWLYVFHVTAIE